jgi:alpha-galactosidase
MLQSTLCSETRSKHVYRLGDIAAIYTDDSATGCVGLEILPVGTEGEVVARRESLHGDPWIDLLPFGEPWAASVTESLVQFKLAGEPGPGGFVQGHSMRQSRSVARFVSSSREVIEEPGATTIVTRLMRADGCRVEHRLIHREGEQGFEVRSAFQNDSSAPVQLEMLSSFSLSGMTPFASHDASGRLRAHRFRSGWSAEGRLVTESIEALHLERSWSGAAAFSERFGQVGTLPVRKWFPFLAIEDVSAGVIWGVQLAWAGSWQMEIFRQHDDVAISGGLADFEFGHWMKTIHPGERFEAPPAFVSCVRGGLDDLCDRLTRLQQRPLSSQPEIEQDLPIIFNEWCTTWGDPSHERLCRLADRLKATPVRYLVIDSGWFKRDDTDWSSGHGDWIPSGKLFPDGIEATAAAIRERGLVPGLWFEMETVGSQATAFSMTKQMLQRHGRPVTCRERRFWNLNDPVAVDFLTRHVIDLLERGGFGYLKVDYNESAGIGFDDADSLGEGLRRQIDAQYRFFDHIRERLPDLVIENCASGGHRLEPSMLARTAMSSFSDAHELPEIPLVAANLHRLILPRQSQIWAVLHHNDTFERLSYSLAATFFGRMCLSGEMDELNEGQWQFVRDAMALYRQAVPVIKHGKSRVFGATSPSWRHLAGWQAVRRISDDGQCALLVLHTFANAPKAVEIPWPDGPWRCAGKLTAQAGSDAEIACGKLQLMTGGDFNGAAFLFTSQDLSNKMPGG